MGFRLHVASQACELQHKHHRIQGMCPSPHSTVRKIITQCRNAEQPAPNWPSDTIRCADGWNSASSSNPCSHDVCSFTHLIYILSQASILPLPVSSLPLLPLLVFHRWNDLRRWQLCKTHFRWMPGCHNGNGMKDAHKQSFYCSLGGTSCVAGSKIRAQEEKKVFLYKRE